MFHKLPKSLQLVSSKINISADGREAVIQYLKTKNVSLLQEMHPSKMSIAPNHGYLPLITFNASQTPTCSYWEHELQMGTVNQVSLLVGEKDVATSP
jgi:hypothetical protein